MVRKGECDSQKSFLLLWPESQAVPTVVPCGLDGGGGGGAHHCTLFNTGFVYKPCEYLTYIKKGATEKKAKYWSCWHLVCAAFH